MSKVQTPIQKKIVCLKEAICQVRKQQSTLTAFIDCLATNLEALGEQVGALERNLTISSTTKKEGK